jgi:hypothetical protein
MRVVAATMLLMALATASRAQSSAVHSSRPDGLLAGQVRASLLVRDTTRFRVLVTVDSLSVQHILHRGYYWGAYRGTPRTIVVGLQVTIGASEIQVPLSAYADLSELRDLWLSWAGTRVDVKLSGGDAAAAWEAHLVFDRGHLISRKVSDGEFPEIWEQTAYHGVMY